MEYYLGDACHNTFVLFDHLEASVVEEDFLPKVHERLLAEGRDDALILFNGESNHGAFYARMMVLGVDGEIAEFCGNGARVAAAYLFAQQLEVENIFLVAGSATYHLRRYENSLFSVQLPYPSFLLNKKFVVQPELLEGMHYVDMLEPHLALQGNLSDEELLQLGRRLNRERAIFPHGINVNAWHLLEDGHLFVKTYERGVQRLTKSCGTGSISCAALYRGAGTVYVSTPGGALEISFRGDQVELKGLAFFFSHRAPFE